jgi:hypothetical protein
VTATASRSSPTAARRSAGREERWSTVGLYRLAGDRVAGCWLLPLDGVAFDRIWG